VAGCCRLSMAGVFLRDPIDEDPDPRAQLAVALVGQLVARAVSTIRCQPPESGPAESHPKRSSEGAAGISTNGGKFTRQKTRQVEHSCLGRSDWPANRASLKFTQNDYVTSWRWAGPLAKNTHAGGLAGLGWSNSQPQLAAREIPLPRALERAGPEARSTRELRRKRPRRR
jgi:hypothetical protein